MLASSKMGALHLSSQQAIKAPGSARPTETTLEQRPRLTGSRDPLRCALAPGVIVQGGVMAGLAAMPLGRQRWIVCALLFVATTINYIDRNALSVLKTRLQEPLEAGGLALTDADYGWITF